MLNAVRLANLKFIVFIFIFSGSSSVEFWHQNLKFANIYIVFQILVIPLLLYIYTLH